MATKVKFSLKYKFLAALVLTVMFVTGTFFFMMHRILFREQAGFVMDLNSTAADAAVDHLALALTTRLEAFPTLLQRIYEQPSREVLTPDNLFRNLPSYLREEVLGVTFYKKGTTGKLEITKRYLNEELWAKNKAGKDTVAELDRSPVQELDTFLNRKGFHLVNRSMDIMGPEGNSSMGILTFVTGGTFSNQPNDRIAVTIDIVQDVIRQSLLKSEMTELFLISKDGSLISHPDKHATVMYAKKPFPHPILERLGQSRFPKEMVELTFEGEPYLCTVVKTGVEDVFLVAQVRKNEAFRALNELSDKGEVFAGLALYVGIVVSIFFARRLTRNLKRLGEAAQAIGAGDLSMRLQLTTGDEVNLVADNFNWMADRLAQLMVQSQEKGRMEQELKTAALVQSTLLTAVKSDSPSYDLEAYYMSASELGGDYWDTSLTDTKLTIMLGDATGHGAAAAIVTAVAKSCLSTLSGIYTEPLPPEEFLAHLNRVIHASCQGKLLMTLCLLQLDLQTGELAVCNAGHEFPFLAKKTEEEGPNVDALLARGERLGYSLDSRYEAVRVQLSPGDTVLLYTDGYLEAVNAEGKPLGERLVRKSFAKSCEQPLPSLKKDLVQTFQSHVGETKTSDDVTFLLMRWNRRLSDTSSSTVLPTPPKPPASQKAA